MTNISINFIVTCNFLILVFNIYYMKETIFCRILYYEIELHRIELIIIKIKSDWVFNQIYYSLANLFSFDVCYLLSFHQEPT